MLPLLTLETLLFIQAELVPVGYFLLLENDFACECKVMCACHVISVKKCTSCHVISVKKCTSVLSSQAHKAKHSLSGVDYYLDYLIYCKREFYMR